MSNTLRKEANKILFCYIKKNIQNINLKYEIYGKNLFAVINQISKITNKRKLNI